MLKKQHSNNNDIAARGLAQVDAYDTLQRNWPHTRSRRTPSLTQAASRMVKRRFDQVFLARQSFSSTAAYYEAIAPLLVADKYLEQGTNWRYICPLMIKVMLHNWPRRAFF